ncbi:ejaculatory bulb-specific protein 3 [Halyomorpha halys]|uniref:ejaculatory bulb-specific protein 3 n=1 Tax=Halyomorpha halys TaxID=286706 RepID=UPI000D0C74FE|nr:ejaculatory bulb-specific protein 3-like [Halyomorpha halys]
MVIVIGLFILTILALAAPLELLPPKVDGHDVTQILTDDKLFQQYFDCVMGRTKCTPGGQIVKDGIPAQLKDGCANCPPIRRIGAQIIVRFMIATRCPQYEEFEKKYDPQQKLRKLYAA